MDYKQIIKDIPTTAISKFSVRCKKCRNFINPSFYYCNFCGFQKTTEAEQYTYDYYESILGYSNNNIKTTVFYFAPNGVIHEKTNIEYSIKVAVFGGGQTADFNMPIYIFPANLNVDELFNNLSKRVLYVHGFDIDENTEKGNILNILPCVAKRDGNNYIVEKKGSIFFSDEKNALSIFGKFDNKAIEKLSSIKKIVL